MSSRTSAVNKTERLYEENAYLTGCGATVLAVRRIEETGPCEEDGDTGAAWEVILNRTVFFPESGGQSADTGWIFPAGNGSDRSGAYRVTDVQIADGVIRHTVRADLPGLAAGDDVTLEIDWERRFGFMQNHTGEHILSGLMHSRYGFDNIGFHLSDHSVTVDVNGQLDEEEILALEREANEVIYRNAEVEILYPSERELPQYIDGSRI